MVSPLSDAFAARLILMDPDQELALMVRVLSETSTDRAFDGVLLPKHW